MSNRVANEQRPHRLARLVEVPQDLEHVPKGRLADIVALLDSQTEPQTQDADPGGSDVRAFLSHCGLEVLRADPYASAVRLTLRQCPFREHQGEGKAAVFINANGSVAFYCFSSHCAGRKWSDLREKFEPSTVTHTNWDGSAAGDLPVVESAPFFQQERSWPSPPDEAAFSGLAGEFVRLVEPHTEADRAGLLLQFLLVYGDWMGPFPYRLAGGQSHHLNEFAVLVGESKQGRKGTAWAEVERFFHQVNHEWMKEKKASGLTTGEGLVHHLRDPTIKREPVTKDGKQTGDYKPVEVDPGVEDKRSLVVEKEFGRTLKNAARDGNTLSAMLREAWDGGNLATLSKNSPARATGAHVSFIGHVTPGELHALLDATDAVNGFGNRFLWCAVQRSKLLPWGGSTLDARMSELVGRVQRAGDNSRRIAEFTFSGDAAALWERVYPELSEEKTGLLGAMIARAEAHVVRLACIYAALDSSGVIETVHLNAALALWSYCERSAEFIFGDRMGNPVADAIYLALRNNPEGLTRTEIRDLFARNRREAEIEAALGLLLKTGRTTCAKEPSGGRPVERWKARLKVPTTETTLHDQRVGN